jgi:hypothetical protein
MRPVLLDKAASSGERGLVLPKMLSGTPILPTS